MEESEEMSVLNTISISIPDTFDCLIQPDTDICDGLVIDPNRPDANAYTQNTIHTNTVYERYTKY